VKSLANGDLNDVLALWSGLGYYARARNLWAAVKTVQSDFKGRIPSDPDVLTKLPGIGPYTAAAITSFSFNKHAAVLHGNIVRVLMRMMAIEDDPKLKAVQVVLRKIGLDLSKSKSKDVNLALMDLGSTVCLPQNPLCASCPAAIFCLAKESGRQNAIPMRGE